MKLLIRRADIITSSSEVAEDAHRSLYLYPRHKRGETGTTTNSISVILIMTTITHLLALSLSEAQF